MPRHSADTDIPLLDPDVWDAPAHLSDEDLYAHAGADRRADPGDRETER